MFKVYRFSQVQLLGSRTLFRDKLALDGSKVAAVFLLQLKVLNCGIHRI